MNQIFAQLKAEAAYAQQSRSKALLYQAYGGAQMARQLGALSKEEFWALNAMTVRFMNTGKRT